MSELYEKSLLKLELDQVLELLAECAGSFEGKEACRRLRPTSDLEDVRLMLDQTTAASDLCTRKGNPGFGEVRDVSASLERAEAFVRALGDDVELLRCCAAMEKLEAAELRSFVEAARLTAARLLPPGRALLHLEEELGRAAEYLRQNVSVKHVLGMLSTYEMRE